MDELRAIAIVACVLIGLFFTLVSTVGVIRLPDVYSRAHTASQADTLGAGFALAGVALAIGVDSTAVKTVLLLFFMFVTNPTAAHAIARAAHEEGIVPWSVEDGADGTAAGTTGADGAGTAGVDGAGTAWVDGTGTAGADGTGTAGTDGSGSSGSPGSAARDGGEGR